MTYTEVCLMLRRNFFSLALILFLIAGCTTGDDNSGGDTVNTTGDLQVRMNWKTNRAKKSSTNWYSPSGDVCVDFSITGIMIRVKNSSGLVVAQSGLLPCADHNAKLDGIAAQSGYRVEVDGIVDDQVLWYGIQTDVTVLAGQSSEPVVVTMKYTGDENQTLIPEILPAATEKNVSTNTDVVVRFNKPMVASTLNTATVMVTNGEDPVPGSITYNPATFEAVFKPDHYLDIATTYTVTVTADIMDLTGSVPAQPVTSQFTTTTVWFVDADASSSGSGSSWKDAFQKLGEAVAAAGDGDSIWVKQGIYKPGEQVIIGKSVSLLGGFGGTETQVYQRDWSGRETIVDGEETYRCFFFSSNVVLDGFTITGGLAHEGVYLSGGGIYIENGSSQINNCFFIKNSAGKSGTTGSGGAIYMATGNLGVEGCTFKENFAKAFAASSGGAIHSNSGVINISGCSFTENFAAGVGGGLGGAIHNNKTKVTINDCLFERNYSAGIGLGAGGAIINTGGKIEIYRSRFVRNYVNGGEGAKGGAVFSIDSTVTFQNNTFYGNKLALSERDNSNEQNEENEEKYSYGGAIANLDNTVSITNCSFSFNEIEPEQTALKFIKGGGAIGSYGSSDTTISASILWGNLSPENPDIYTGENAKTQVFSSNIEQPLFDGMHNMSKNPKFGDRLHLRFDSPCRDRVEGEGVTILDIDSESRLANALLDIGADQFIDGDGDHLPDYWEKQYGASTPSGDEDGDQLTNLTEYNLGTDPNRVQHIIDATKSGAIRYDNVYQNSEPGTHVGKLDDRNSYHAFFAFDVSSSKPVKKAAIRLVLTNLNSNVPLDIQAWDVDAVTAQVLSGEITRQPEMNLYYDLSGGNLYGEMAIGLLDADTILEFELSRTAVAAINLAATEKKVFYIGFALKKSGGYISLGAASDGGVHQLILVDE